eukprot:gene5887-9715_t
MLGLVDYGSTDEEVEEKPVIQEEKEKKIKTLSFPVQETETKRKEKKKKKKRKFSKAEIFQRLEIENNEGDDFDEIEEDLSYQVSKKQKIEPEMIQSQQLNFNRNSTFTPSSKSFYDNIVPVSKNSSDFMSKLSKIVSGEQKISESSTSDLKFEAQEIPKQINKFDTKETIEEENYDEDDFVIDPEEYVEDEQVETFYEIEKAPIQETTEKKVEDNIDDLNIPKDVLDKLKSDHSIIDIADAKKMKEEREAMRRREMIEKHKMSVYENKQPLKQFSNLEKSKSSLSYLANESRRTEYERAQRKEEAARNQKKSRSKYGW